MQKGRIIDSTVISHNGKNFRIANRAQFHEAPVKRLWRRHFDECPIRSSVRGRRIHGAGKTAWAQIWAQWRGPRAGRKRHETATLMNILIDELRNTDKKPIELLNQSAELFTNPHREILLRWAFQRRARWRRPIEDSGDTDPSQL